MENCFDLPPIILYLSEFKNAADIQDQDIRWNVNVFWWFAISPLNNYLMSYPFDISVRISSWNKNKQILISDFIPFQNHQIDGFSHPGHHLVHQQYHCPASFSKCFYIDHRKQQVKSDFSWKTPSRILIVWKILINEIN